MSRSEDIKAGSRRAVALRKLWLDKISSGESSVADLIEVATSAKRGDHDFSLKKLTLLQVFSALHGEQKGKTAIQSLVREELSPDTQLGQLTRRPAMRSKVIALSLASVGALEELPIHDDWPWAGNLREILRGQGLKELDDIDKTDEEILEKREQEESVERDSEDTSEDDTDSDLASMSKEDALAALDDMFDDDEDEDDSARSVTDDFSIEDMMNALEDT